MAKDKMDEMRQKLNLDSIDESKKRDMFKKFVNAGGQVVDMNKADKTGVTVKKNENPAGNLQNTNIGPEKPKIYSRQKEAVEKKVMVFNQNSGKIKPMNKWIGYISAKLGCIISGILTFKGDSFKNAFKELILNQYQNTLINTRMILASILYQDKIVSTEIKKKFMANTAFANYFEIIYRFDNLFNDELFKKLSVIRNSAKTVNLAKPLFIQLFKPIFILHPYYSTLKTGVENALIIEKDIRKLDSNITYINIKKLQTYIDFIFTKVYVKIFALIEYYYKLDLKGKNILFKDFIDLRDEDRIGYLNEKWKEELSKSIKKEEENIIKIKAEELRTRRF